MTPGVGEVYTPMLVGADGIMFAQNDATRFAIGGAQSVPEPAGALLFGSFATAATIVLARGENRRRFRRQH